MANEANIKAVITAEDKASTVLKGFSNNVSSMADHIGNFVKKAAEGLLVAGGAAVAFGVSSVKAFSESQDLIAQTNAVLKSTAGIAGVTADEVTKLATALQKSTTFSDEEVRSTENLLLTFTAIGKDIFPQATKAVLNMATALGEDTKSASIQLGKALQDPILGITALRRVGVNFNDAQKEVVKNLVNTGQSAKAQQYILKELETEFGGSAEAARGTFSGALKGLKNTLNDVQESIGQVIVKSLTPLAQRFADFVASDKFQKWLKDLTDWLNINLPKAADYIVNTLLPNLKKLFDDVWPSIKNVMVWAGDMFTFLLDHKWIIEAIALAFVSIKTAMLLTGALQAFQAVMTGAAASYGGLAALVASPMMMNLVVAGALADIALVAKAIQTVQGSLNALNNTKVAVQGLQSSNQAVYDRLIRETQAPYSPEVQAAARKALAGLYGSTGGGGGFALGGFTGSGPANEVAGVVHKGEYVLPQSQVNQSTGQPNLSGNSVNITIQTGALMGSDVEARKFAMIILDHLKTAAGSKNMSLADMIGA